MLDIVKFYFVLFLSKYRDIENNIYKVWVIDNNIYNPYFWKYQSFPKPLRKIPSVNISFALVLKIEGNIALATPNIGRVTIFIKLIAPPIKIQI